MWIAISIILIFAAFIAGVCSGRKSRNEEFGRLISDRDQLFQQWKNECGHSAALEKNCAYAIDELQKLKDAIRQKAAKKVKK